VNDEAIRLEATVRGLVQGVGFRWYIVRRGSEFGLTGWTANQADGSVRVVAEGSPAAVDRLLELLNRGPSGARVEAVESMRVAATGEFSSFTVKSGAHGGD
jgi:acylphosphatase